MSDLIPKRTATLEDLYQEKWLRERNQGALVWRTKEGKEIAMKNMADSHLRNAIRLLENKAEMEYKQTGVISIKGTCWTGDNTDNIY